MRDKRGDVRTAIVVGHMKHDLALLQNSEQKADVVGIQATHDEIRVDGGFAHSDSTPRTSSLPHSHGA